MVYRKVILSSLQATTRAHNTRGCRYRMPTTITAGLKQHVIVGTASQRCKSSSSSSQSDNKSNSTIKKNQDDLKWTERDEAPKWMQKMAPSKGGTKLPNAVEGAVIVVVAIAGYYAWFVEPPAQASAAVDDGTTNIPSTNAAKKE